jgi:ATP-binding cassette, subfamily B, bacterial HlyB/CyaB
VETAELKGLLAESAVFSVVSEEELAELTESFDLAHYPLGQAVVRAGDESDSFFVVYSGRARVVAEKLGEEVTVGTLTRGNHFGEQGLLRQAKREFTVRAAEDLVVLRLRKKDFNRLRSLHPDLDRYFDKYLSEISIRNFLKLCTVFSPLSAAGIRDLLGCLETRDYPPQQPIVREGEPGDAFYILRSGSAVVVKDSSDGQVVNHLRPGDFFGELALLTGQPRAATVIAQEPSSVFRLEKSAFERILAAAPKIKEAIVGVASGYAGAAAAEAQAAPLPDQSAELPPAPAQPDPGQAPYRPRRARRYPALLQLSESDCGPACLAMILRYYRKKVSTNRIRALTGAARGGVSLYSLAEAAEVLGFHARGIQAAFDHLAQIELPAVAHWEGAHYVVLYEVRPDRVVVADPALGLRRLTRAEFLRGWTGYLLLLSPTPRLDGVQESQHTLARYLPVLKPYRKQLAEIFLASALLQLFNLASPIFTQVVVDRVLVRKSAAMLNTMLFGMLIVAVFQTLTVALRKYLMVHTSRSIDMAMAVDFYRHTLSLPIRFFEERKVGDILKRFNENQKIRDLLTGRGFLATLDCVMIVVYLALMLYYNLKLSLLAMLFMAGYATLTVCMTPALKTLNREVFRRSAEAESNLVESVAGVGTVKATASERPVRWQWEELMVKALNVRFRTAMTGVTSNALGTILQSLNSTFLLWYGARLVIADELTIGQLMAFTALAANMNRPVLMLIELWSEFQEVSVAIERLNDVFDTRPEEESGGQGLMRLPPARGHVRFENVTFRYPTRTDRNALQNVNLEIYPGQTVALVGRSGAGKSTFAGLLLRLYLPNQGRILIDGHDLRQVSIASLRSQIGVVPQEVVLFSGTIRRNIAFGQPDAPLEEVAGAAMLAGAHEFIIALPRGYDAVIGERGQSLSGGQKQRIAIARALFKKPRILIFDEATSALDTESERAIQQNLDNILKGRTTFVIAHRLSTIRNADLIVVMDNGQIIETGTHYSLMEQGGMYYYLNSQQLEG